MTEPLLVGLDIGTTGLKAGLVDARGGLVAMTTAPCEVQRPAPGQAEQDPEDYWRAAAACIRELLAVSRVEPGRIVALSSCGHAPTMVLLDGDDSPVRPAILWQDTRAVTEAEELARDPGPDALAEALGVRWPIDASMPMARFRWLGRHEPDVLRRVRHALLPKDYVHLRLTGEATTDPWSAKGLVHQSTLMPIEALRDLAGVDPAVAPRAVASSDVVGYVSTAAAQETGLPAGLPVVAGWTDAMAAMLGTGALGRKGLACDVSGTSEVIGLTFGYRPEHTGPLMCADVSGGRWMVYGPTQASGASLGWALRAFGVESTAAALAEAADAPPGADGLLFLPYLQGERAPLWDPRARGVFAGLTTGHERAHLLRAVLEGVGCSVRHVLGAAESVGGVPAEEVRVAGGGARLELWNHIKADLTGRQLRPCATSENGVLGTAMLAALGAGIYPDVPAAGEAMVQLLEPVLPDDSCRPLYDALFERYVAFYPRVRDLMG